MTLAEFQWNCCVAGDISVLFVIDFMTEDFFNNSNDSNDCTAYAFRFLHFALRPCLFCFGRPDLFYNHRSYIDVTFTLQFRFEFIEFFSKLPTRHCFFVCYHAIETFEIVRDRHIWMIQLNFIIYFQDLFFVQCIFKQQKQFFFNLLTMRSFQLFCLVTESD